MVSHTVEEDGKRVYKSPHGTRPVRHLDIFRFAWQNHNAAKDDKPAVVYAPTGETLTRGELRDGAQRFAHGLRHKVKVQPGEVVCVFSPNSLHWHLLAFGCQCAGVVVSPANAAYTPSELAHQLRESGAVMVLVHPALVEVAQQAAKEAKWSDEQIKTRFYLAVPKKEAEKATVPSFDELMGDELLSPHRVKDPKNTVAWLCFSSGTTSAAKGVMTTHSNMCSVLSILDAFGAKGRRRDCSVSTKLSDLQNADVIAAVLPFSHIYGLTKLIHWPVLLGLTVVVLPRFDLKVFCESVPKYRISLAFLVPPVLLLLAKEKMIDEYDFSSLRAIWSGAAPLSADIEEAVEKRINVKIRNAYGLTESSPTSHMCPTNVEARGSIGMLLPNVDARVVHPETLKDVPEGEQGELLMRGPSIMLGYLNRKEATAETLIDDNGKDGPWLRTGDIVTVKDDLFRVEDRMKELVKYKGFQVPPAELEAALIALPSIQDAAVIGIYSEEQATELPRAYVVPTDADHAKRDPKAFEKEIQDAVAKRVAQHKKLRGGVAIVEAIPKSPSGKILRRQLKEKYLKEEAPKAKAKL